MEKNQLSRTALITAFSRGYHSINDNSKIFDDLALQLLTEDECSFIVNQ
jgi:O-methyltransferase involved in polyketide biosynthesis